MNKHPLDGYNVVNMSLETMSERIMGWSPVLKGFQKEGQTLGAYFSRAAAWGPQAHYPMQGRAIELIGQRVDRQYGKETAQGVVAQLSERPLVESGTHVSLPRDYDFGHPDVTFDNDVTFQGVVMSAGLYRSAGLKYHIGLYSSRIPAGNTNGAEHGQFSPQDHHVRMVSSKKANGIMTLLDPIADDHLDTIAASYDNLYFQKRKDRAARKIGALPIDERRKTVWSEFLHRERGYSAKNVHTISTIEAEMAGNGFKLRSYDKQEKYVQKIIATMKSPLADKTAKHGFADQIMAAQTKLLNRVTPPDVKQVTVDFAEISVPLMVESLRDKESRMHKIFADAQVRDKFVYDLADIRSGWSRDRDGVMQSPFVAVHSSKGVSRLERMPYEENKDQMTPEKLADALEQGKIAPTCALEVAYMVTETGFMFHGGMFQAIYTNQIQDKYSRFLDEMNETQSAASLRAMPLDTVTLSPAIATMADQRLLRYSDLLKKPMTRDEADKIPHIPSAVAINVAAPMLHNFFVYYEPHLAAGVRDLASNEAAQIVYGDYRNETTLITRPAKNVSSSAGQRLEALRRS